MSTLLSNQPLNTNLKLAEAFLSGASRYREVGSKIFNNVTPKRATEVFAVNTGMGLLQQVGENSAYPQVDMNEIGNVNVSQQMFKKELPYSKLMKRFDNYEVIAREASRGGYRMMQTRDNIMASVLRNAATTQLVWDGLSLLNAAHLIGTTGLTQSNIVTGGLTESTLQDAQRKLFELKDLDGVVGALEGSVLVVPPALKYTAWKLLESQGSPTTANRYTNPLNGNNDMQKGDSGMINIEPWAFIGAAAGGSDTTCYLMADKLFHTLNYLESIAPTMVTLDPTKTTTGGETYRFDYAGAATAVDYRGIVGITA